MPNTSKSARNVTVDPSKKAMNPAESMALSVFPASGPGGAFRRIALMLQVTIAKKARIRATAHGLNNWNPGRSQRKTMALIKASIATDKR